MKKFFPVKIIETRWTTVAIEGESIEEVRRKSEAVAGVFLGQRCESSVLVASMGTSGTLEEMGEYICYDGCLRRVSSECNDQNVFNSKRYGKLYFHEHIIGTKDCKMCALSLGRDDDDLALRECALAPCARHEREDLLSGYFSKVENKKEAIDECK